MSIFEIIVGTVVGRTTDQQRNFPQGNFNLRECLNQNNISSDLIDVEVLIQANIVSNSEGVRNFQHRRYKGESPR